MNAIERYFVIAWSLLVIVSGWIGFQQAESKWSNQMGIRKNLGFEGHLSSPLIASQLAPDANAFAKVFGRGLDSSGTRLKGLPDKTETGDDKKEQAEVVSPAEAGKAAKEKAKPDPLIDATRRDATNLRKLLGADYVFILCYVPLMIIFAMILGSRGVLPTRLMWAVVVAVAVTAAADLLENVGARKSLAMLTAKDINGRAEGPRPPKDEKQKSNPAATAGEAGTPISAATPAATPAAATEVEDVSGRPTLDNGVIKRTHIASLVKWFIFALVSMVLGWGTARLRSFQSSLTSLVLAGGGACVLWGVITSTGIFGDSHAGLIQVGFAFICLGALLAIFVATLKSPPLPPSRGPVGGPAPIPSFPVGPSRGPRSDAAHGAPP